MFAAVPLGLGFADKKEEGLNNLFSWLGGTFTAEWQIKFTTDGIKKRKKKENNNLPQKNGQTL